MKGGSQVAVWAARIALAAGFLSAVADRLGLWGSPGADGVGWGTMQSYAAYVGKLLWFLRPEAVEPTAWAITVVEVILAIGLLVGWQLRWMALGTALLLAAFGAAIVATVGPKAALDSTIFPAAAAAFLLSAQGKGT